METDKGYDAGFVGALEVKISTQQRDQTDKSRMIR